uniref:Uncharacterized protein n=1 Tax=Myzus persicae nege-like virus 1 TaxID=2961857 RepID=A0A976X7I7_9VIRU|nr:hypothetical protein 2 [Myzus persicae nege-like virus 1]
MYNNSQFIAPLLFVGAVLIAIFVATSPASTTHRYTVTTFKTSTAKRPSSSTKSTSSSSTDSFMTTPFPRIIEPPKKSIFIEPPRKTKIVAPPSKQKFIDPPSKNREIVSDLHSQRRTIDPPVTVNKIIVPATTTPLPPSTALANHSSAVEDYARTTTSTFSSSTGLPAPSTSDPSPNSYEAFRPGTASSESYSFQRSRPRTCGVTPPLPARRASSWGSELPAAYCYDEVFEKYITLDQVENIEGRLFLRYSDDTLVPIAGPSEISSCDSDTECIHFSPRTEHNFIGQHKQKTLDFCNSPGSVDSFIILDTHGECLPKHGYKIPNQFLPNEKKPRTFSL